MEFPLKSLGTFGVAFGVANLLFAWLRAFVFGWADPDVGPQISFFIEMVASLTLFIPVAALSFALAAYAVRTERDPWLRALVGGVALAIVCFGVSTLHLESYILARATAWGVLSFGAAIVGAWARASARAADDRSATLRRINAI